jgi:hypothetical protein
MLMKLSMLLLRKPFSLFPTCYIFILYISPQAQFQELEPQTPERNRQSQREHDHIMRQHQMTSPSIRRQRREAHQTNQAPIAQPNFGSSSTSTAPVPPVSRHPPVPVDEYPGLPRHSIAFHNRQAIYHHQHASERELQQSEQRLERQRRMEQLHRTHQLQEQLRAAERQEELQRMNQNGRGGNPVSEDPFIHYVPYPASSNAQPSTSVQ